MPSIYEIYESVICDSEFLKQNEIAVREILCQIQGFAEMSDFYVNKDQEIDDLPRFQSYLARFLNGEPVQYILNSARFLKDDYYVDSRVLIPRMETEEVVNYAIKEIEEKYGQQPLSIIDIGTGSGVIAISLKKRFPNSKMTATDISQDALAVAKINANKHHQVIDFMHGKTLEPLIFCGRKVNVLVSNPPYIIKQDDIDDSVIRYEPINALVDESDMAIYEMIFQTYQAVASYPFLMVFEIGYDMKDKLEILLNRYFDKSSWQLRYDINGKLRILSIYIEKE
ncbi:MAG: peptide chain release factor N(5)-glutamine methyltransferase [Bacteroidia bacterium]|nr:peptide chain release factor N(5)-glutamine methyltransferase [Bacteroidia bacterium]